MFRKMVSLIAISFLTVSCAKWAPQPAAKPLARVSDPAMIDTAEAASSVSRALNDLANVKDVQNKLVREEDEAPPLVLTRLLTIDWSGPVEPLLRQVAQASQLSLKVLGHNPAIPVMVSLDRRETMAYDILQDIRGQVNGRATVVVFPTSGVIELHYL
jgi:defect-in-organelle-trafficking protein DotD